MVLASSTTDFNPRSRMGSDHLLIDDARTTNNFNPRSRMGSDPQQPLLRIQDQISIHAPAWGATKKFFSTKTSSLFQSTLPHGERRKPFSQSARYFYFNPRSRMGSDTKSASLSASTGTFQSTLPHGERQTAYCPAVQTWAFQSTLPHGERPATNIRLIHLINFNPRSRMGSDRLVAACDGGQADFNPRSRMGSDRCQLQIASINALFQSTLPHGERH